MDEWVDGLIIRVTTSIIELNWLDINIYEAIGYYVFGFTF